MILMPIDLELASIKHKIKILMVTTIFPSVLFPLILHIFVIIIWLWFCLLVCKVLLFGSGTHYVDQAVLSLQNAGITGVSHSFSLLLPHC